MFDPTGLLGFHTDISLVAIVAGLVVLAGLLRGNTCPGWTLLFLVTAVLTDVTGFPLPAEHFLPSHAFGIISLLVLAAAILGRYAFHYAGAWRWIYVIGVVVAEYLLLFVGVFQAFLKIPAVHALAPTQAEPPFAVAQGLLLLIMVVLGVLAVRAFRPAR
jgi:hypothetical protein